MNFCNVRFFGSLAAFALLGVCAGQAQSSGSMPLEQAQSSSSVPATVAGGFAQFSPNSKIDSLGKAADGAMTHTTTTFPLPAIAGHPGVVVRAISPGIFPQGSLFLPIDPQSKPTMTGDDQESRVRWHFDRCRKRNSKPAEIPGRLVVVWNPNPCFTVANWEYWQQDSAGSRRFGNQGPGTAFIEAAGTRNIFIAGIRPYYWIADNIAIGEQAFGSYQDNVRGEREPHQQSYAHNDQNNLSLPKLRKDRCTGGDIGRQRSICRGSRTRDKSRTHCGRDVSQAVASWPLAQRIVRAAVQSKEIDYQRSVSF
jgi:hypothetical protein